MQTEACSTRASLLDPSKLTRPVKQHPRTYWLAAANLLDRATHTRPVERSSNSPDLRAFPSLRHFKDPPHEGDLVFALTKEIINYTNGNALVVKFDNLSNS